MTSDGNSSWAFAAFLAFPLTDHLIDRHYGEATSQNALSANRR